MCLKPESDHFTVLCSNFYSQKVVKGHRVQIHRLNRRRRITKEAKERDAEMKVRNLKLYMENKIIIEQNEKLRKKALLLHQENQALMLQLQNKLSQNKNGLVQTT